MSKQINPAKLGVFVLVAIALGLGTLAVVSSGKLFRKTVPFVMYFDADASGLKTGAPVLYRGVTVGQVTRIQLVFDSDRQDMLVPVYIEIDPARFVLQGSSGHYPMMEDLVKEGLRAQLQTQSFVTGMLQIMLVHMPEVPVDLKGGDPETREIPTAPAFTQILADEFKNLDLEGMAADLRGTLADIRKITRRVDEEDMIGQVAGVLLNLNSLSEELKGEFPAISDEALKTSQSLRELAGKANKVLDHSEKMLAQFEQRTPDLLESFQKNVDEFIELQNSLRDTVKQAEGMLAQDSPLRYNIALALDRYTKVASKLETFLDTLERNPESILTGKPAQP